MNIEPLPWTLESFWTLVQIGVQASIVVGVVVVILGVLGLLLAGIVYHNQ